MNAPVDEAVRRFHTETLKLLLQVAWGDGSAGVRELEVLERMARDLSIDETLRAELPSYFLSGRPLPAPDLGLLRQQRTGVVALAKLLAAVDGRDTEEERQLIAEINSLLGG